MPSIFLTSYNSAEPVPLFTKKGIAHLMPGKVTAPTIFVKTATFVLYPLAFIQMAVICCVTKLVTELSTGYTALFKGITLAHAFNEPICTFRFGKLTPEQITSLKAMGLMQDLTNPNLFTGNPGAQQLANIWKMQPVEDRLRPGFVGSDGFFSWVFLMKGVQAFITARNNTDGRANMRYSLKTSVKFDKEGDVLRVGKDIFKGKMGFGSGRSIVTTQDIFLHPPAQDLSSLPGHYLQIAEGKSLPDNAVGFYFPYFAGMNVPDKEVAAVNFSKFFPNLLHDSVSVNNSIMRQIISGNRSLCFSEAGLALAHIYRVFDISLRMEDVSMSVLLRGNIYAGMVIICHPETVLTMYGQEYTASEVNLEIRKIDLLETQAEKIVSLLSGAMEIDGVERRAYEPADFLTSRRALRNWNTVNLGAFAASDILKQVREILSTMDFADTFAPLTASHVQRATAAMITKDFSGLDSFPAYLGGPVLNDRSSVTEALSMFGAMVPSCNTGQDKNSVVITIPSSDKPDANLTSIEGIRPLKYIPFYSVPIGTAVVQWQKMISGAVLRIPQGRKDKKEFANLHRAVFSISTIAELTTFYSGVKQMCDEARNNQKAGNKRKRDGDEGGVSKRARAMESGFVDGL